MKILVLVRGRDIDLIASFTGNSWSGSWGKTNNQRRGETKKTRKKKAGLRAAGSPARRKDFLGLIYTVRRCLIRQAYDRPST